MRQFLIWPKGQSRMWGWKFPSHIWGVCMETLEGKEWMMIGKEWAHFLNCSSVRRLETNSRKTRSMTSGPWAWREKCAPNIDTILGSNVNKDWKDLCNHLKTNSSLLSSCNSRTQNNNLHDSLQLLPRLDNLWSAPTAKFICGVGKCPQ